MLLLDEITVDLDVLGRADLMNYLRAESEERGACIVYATVSAQWSHSVSGLRFCVRHAEYAAVTFVLVGLRV